MISFQQLRRFFLIASLAVILTIATAFSFGSVDSWATTPLRQLLSQPQTQIATLNRAEAITRNIEGKVQYARGKAMD